MASIVTVTDATFDEVVGSDDTPVLVDCWAEWCGPCKQIAPILEELAVEQDGKLRIAKLDVDENPGTARRFNVMSIPTMLVFAGDDRTAETQRIVGAKGKRAMLEDLASVLG